jgi:diguanylate cyclase (GGDEF)-like protein/PAS domain S-box-containing protein
MLRDFVINISLIIASLFIIGRIYTKPLFLHDHLKKTKIVFGLLLGLLGLLLMTFSISVEPSVMVDLRHLPTVIAAFYGGFIPSIVAAAITAFGRLLLVGFDVSQTSLIASFGIILIGIVCGMLSFIRLRPVFQFFMMNVAGMIIISLTIFLNVHDRLIAFHTIGWHWAISIAFGFVTQYAAQHILVSNNLMYKLELSEERYRKLILNLPDATVICRDDSILFINEKGAKLLGARSHHELIGKSLCDFIYAPDIKETRERIALLSFGQQPKESWEQKLIRMDGTIVDVELSASQVSYNNHHAILITMRDVANRKQTEKKLQDAIASLQRLSHLDGLTGIANRQKFDKVLEEEWTSAADHSRRLSLVLFDVDFFRAYNDIYGHLSGDECLKTIASTVDDMLQGSNRFFARYGGEEFAVILPDTGRETAAAVAESIRKKVEALQIPHDYSGANGRVTISLGVASAIPSLLVGAKELIDMSDKALAKAKEEGRNRVVVFK